jgi:peptidoglycan-N-acetylglucosamine deacetylase
MRFRLDDLLAFLTVLLLSHAGAAQRVAITFDDLPLNGSLPPGMTEVDVATNVLAILKKNHVPPVYGFVNAHKLEGNTGGAAAVKLWITSGQRLGNHTYSHLDLTKNTRKAFERDIEQDEPVLELLSPSDQWHWLRYPFLHEGDTIEKRRAVRDYLAKRGYRIAQTTLDYEDYLWNSSYARCVAKKDAVSIAQLKSTYLHFASVYIDLDRQMAVQLFGHDIDHILLLHLGAFSSTILPEVLDMLKQKGLKLATLEEVERDAALHPDPDFPSPMGGTLLEQLMDARRLKYPDFPKKPYAELESICR